MPPECLKLVHSGWSFTRPEVKVNSISYLPTCCDLSKLARQCLLDIFAKLISGKNNVTANCFFISACFCSEKRRFLKHFSKVDHISSSYFTQILSILCQWFPVLFSGIRTKRILLSTSKCLRKKKLSPLNIISSHTHISSSTRKEMK